MAAQLGYEWMAFVNRDIPGKTPILKNRATYTMAKPFRSTRGWGLFLFINRPTSPVYIVIHYLNSPRYTIFGPNLFTQQGSTVLHIFICYGLGNGICQALSC